MIFRQLPYLFILSTLSLFGAYADGSTGQISVDFEKDSSLPLVHLTFLMRGGSAADPHGKSGLADLTGKMLLRGTHPHVKAKINLALDQIGAKIEVETRLEHLLLRGSVLSSELETFLTLFTEILTQPSFLPEEVHLLKAQQIAAIQDEQGDDASLAWRHFNQFLFGQDSYGQPVLGKIQDIQQLARQDLVDFYHRIIQSPDMTLVGSGDAEPQRLETWMAELQRLKPVRSTIQPEISMAAPPEHVKRRLLLVRKPDRTQAQIYIGQLGIRMSDRDFFPLFLANHVFGGPTLTTTLMREIRIQRGWSYGAMSWFKFGLKPRSWQVYLFPAIKDTPQALQHTLHLIDDLSVRGLTREEFDFGKSSLIKKSRFMYSTAEKRSENKVLEKILHLPQGFIASYADHIMATTLEEANAKLKTYLQPDRLTITVLTSQEHSKALLSESAQVPLTEVQEVAYTQE